MPDQEFLSLLSSKASLNVNSFKLNFLSDSLLTKKALFPLLSLPENNHYNQIIL